MQKFAYSSLLLVLFIALAHGSSIKGVVVGVSDGDTLTILDDSKEQHKIRLAKIDAPETAQSFGNVSKQNLSKLCYKKNATAEVETVDRYRRKVATVYCDEVEVNLEQVKAGLAWVYRKYTDDEQYYEAEKMAKSQKRGIWSLDNLMPAWEYRRSKKDTKKAQQQKKDPSESGHKYKKNNL